MNKKLLISYFVAFAVLGIGMWGNKKLGTKKEKKVVHIQKEIPGIRIEKVLNSKKAISFKSNGTLSAKNKIDLFSEVQGIFENSAHSFRSGVSYRKGEILMQINSQEFRSNLQIQKSNFYQKLVTILPDLKLDYPNQFDKWERYIQAFDMDQSVKILPTFDDQREKLFITGRGIPTAYYSVKNLEERLSKYTIYAPYNGILTQANINKGTLVNPGQRLGAFISPNVFELEVTLSSSMTQFVKIGKQLKLQSLDAKQQWMGKITRINPIVNPKSQSISFFVQVAGKGLQEGMYLEALIESNNDKLVYEINRSLLVDGNNIYTVKSDSLLELKSISVLHFNEKTALVEGLTDGEFILSQPLPGAFDGKVVKLIKH